MPLLRVQYPLPFFEASAVVVPSDAPDVVKRNARAFKTYYGDLVQLCDGVDDDVEINAAIAALPAAGGLVLLLEGRYRIAAGIDIMVDDISLVGQGSATILEAQGAITVIQLGDAGHEVEHIYIGHMMLWGDTWTGNVGIELYDCVRSTIENVEIASFSNWGIDAQFNHSLYINKCWIWGTGDGSLVPGVPYVGGIKIGDPTRDLPFNACRITDTLVEWCHDGIWIFGAASTTIRDCVVEGCNNHGIVLDQRASVNFLPVNTIIDTVAFESNDQLGAANIADIYCEKAVYNLTISNCSFYDTVTPQVTWCVRVGAAGNFKNLGFTNNYFHSNCAENLYINDGTNAIIEGNRFSTSLHIVGCKGVSPLDISQWSDADDCFTTLENSVGSADGLMVYVPWGTYTLSEKFVVPDNDITIFGQGRGCVLALADGVDDNMISATGKSGLFIHDVEIDGNRANNAGADPILLNNCSGCRIEGNFIHDCDDNAIKLEAGSSDNRIKNNYIEDCDVDGVLLDASDDNIIQDNIFRTCATPVNISNATSDRNMVLGNNWNGCTNDMNDASATTRITVNIDKNGAWFAGDNPG